MNIDCKDCTRCACPDKSLQGRPDYVRGYAVTAVFNDGTSTIIAYYECFSKFDRYTHEASVKNRHWKKAKRLAAERGTTVKFLSYGGDY